MILYRQGGDKMDYFRRIIHKENDNDKNLTEDIKDYSSMDSSIKTFLSANARQAIAACIVAAMVAGGTLYYNEYKKTAYAVSYNGKKLGYVRDKQSAANAFESVKEEIKKQNPSIYIAGELSFEKVKLESDESGAVENITQEIKSGVYAELTSYAITVNGNEVALVRTEDEGKQVVEELKKYFAEQEKKNGAEVLEVNIKDDINVVSRIADSKPASVQDAVDALIGDKTSVKKYEIKQGDSLWTIARNNDVKLNDIVAANPGLDVEKLQPGQTINLTESAPNVSVEVTLNVTSDEKVACDTKYTSDSSLYKGQTKVVEEGHNGINKVVSKVTKLNGVEIARSVIASAIVKSPVTRIVAKGTKDIIGTGAFKWPTRGTLTSKFGSRWGGFHAGIDIGAPQGTPIYAADGGTVTMAGRYYGYGNLVIINHKNGYSTYYGHCSAIYVKEGQSVTKGQSIAAVGHTGDAYGNHVHFEVRVNGKPQNPLNYLK